MKYKKEIRLNQEYDFDQDRNFCDNCDIEIYENQQYGLSYSSLFDEEIYYCVDCRDVTTIWSDDDIGEGIYSNSRED